MNYPLIHSELRVSHRIIYHFTDSLLHEESVDGLLLPDELDNQSVQVNKQCSPKATGDAADTHTHTEDNEGNSLDVSLPAIEANAEQLDL